MSFLRAIGVIIGRFRAALVVSSMWNMKGMMFRLIASGPLNVIRFVGWKNASNVWIFRQIILDYGQ